ncbi:glutaredoxin family protein [Desulfosarcina sp. OttesenSCG-928-G17]|nr:glutaredoxin family protein [Desulfosarcina sp. OttesenSCG-928-G17]
MPVKIFTLSTCSHCNHTKQFLNQNGVKYNFVDVDLLRGDERAEAIEEVKRFNPRCSFPTLVIGNQVVVGFRENEIREALGL